MSLLLFSVAALTFGPRYIFEDIIIIGQNTGTEFQLRTANGQGHLKFDETTGLTQSLDGGTTFEEIAGGGGGGSAGINFVVDGSFENEEQTLGATVTFQEYEEDDLLYSEFNKKFARHYVNPPSSFDYNDTFGITVPRTGMDGKQGLFSMWLKLEADANVNNSEICLAIDETAPIDFSTCESSYKRIVPKDGKWHKYEIPFTYGASSVYLGIETIAYSGVTVEVADEFTLDIDKLYIGTVPDGHSIALQEIDTTTVDPIEFTPVFTNFTLGNGTINNAWYARSGKFMTGEVDITLGSTSAMGTDPQFAVPNDQKIDTELTVLDNAIVLGRAALVDTGTEGLLGFTTSNNESLIKIRVERANGGGSTYNRQNIISNSAPFTWTTSDRIIAKFTVPIKGWSTETTTVATQATLSPDSAGFVFMSLLDIPESDTYLKADGRCVLRSKYPDYIKNGALDTYGTCTVTTTDDGVLLPDLRGYFPRFLDDLGTSQGAASVDVDGTARVVGETQDDQLASHRHSITGRAGKGTSNAQPVTVSDNYTSTAYTNYEGGTETRPVNMGFIPYVRMVDKRIMLAEISENSMQDKYSEAEIKWGKWNGEQLYRRCFTVGSDITSASTIATWDTGLVPKGLTNYIGTYWLIQARSTSANEALLAYDSSNGEIGAFFTGTSYKIGAGTTHCLEYTK